MKPTSNERPTLDRIVGVDPGLNVTGYGVIQIDNQSMTIVEAGIIRGRAKGSLVDRVQDIYQGIVDVIENCQPTAMAVEELYSHYERPKTAILMGHARGVICLAAANANCRLKHYAATRVKKMLTGSGRASKAQMQAAIQREFDLESLPTPADVADALAVAVCHYYLRDTANQLSEAKPQMAQP